jgi:hypothetical protein
MKDSDYQDLIELTHINGQFIPSNQKAIELASNLRDGERSMVKLMTNRDIKLHRCYFALLNYVWLWLPDNFKKQVPAEHFYKFLKMVQGQYDVVFEFKDGTKMIEYHSISFGKMSNEKFKEFVKEQISVIYNDVIIMLFKDDEKANHIIQETETEFEKFFNKL